jgi:hypothetical protein
MFEPRSKHFFLHLISNIWDSHMPPYTMQCLKRKDDTKNHTAGMNIRVIIKNVTHDTESWHYTLWATDSAIKENVRNEYYTKMRQMNPLHILFKLCSANSAPPCTRMSLQSASHSVHIKLVVRSFTRDKCFGLAQACQRGLEGNTTVGKQGEVEDQSANISTICATSLINLSTVGNSRN